MSILNALALADGGQEMPQANQQETILPPSEAEDVDEPIPQISEG